MTVFVVKEWNEDQPRDPDGRFAGGGEGQGRFEDFGGPKWEDAKATVSEANVGQPYGTKDPAVARVTTTNDHPDTYYHTSKTENRDSIKENGLEAGRSLGGKNTRVYLAEDKPEGMGKPRSDMKPHDTYEIDTRGLPLRPDPENPGGWAISEQDISPDRIKLIATTHPDGMPKSRFGGNKPAALVGPRQRVRAARGVANLKGAATVAHRGHGDSAVATGLDRPAPARLLGVGTAGHAPSVTHATKEWDPDQPRDADGRFGSGGGDEKWPTSQAEMDRMSIDTRDPTQTVSGDKITADTPLLVYHATSYKDDANAMQEHGVEPGAKPGNLAQERYERGEEATYAPGAGISRETYVSAHPNDASGYGRYMVAMKVPAGDLHVPPESTAPGSGLEQALRAASDANGATVAHVSADSVRPFGSDPGMIPQRSIGELEGAKATPKIRLFLVKDWQDEERDEQGRWSSGGGDGRASLEDAHEHISSAAQSFRDAGGTIQTLKGTDPSENFRAAERELRGLTEGLRQAAGDKGLPERVSSGLRMAFVALSSGRSIDSATIDIARTADGHIAAVMSTNPNHVVDPDTTKMGFLGSTGIAHGAGSALIEQAMDRASKAGLAVELEPLDKAAEDYWRGTVGAGTARFGQMGWTPDEVKQLAA